MKDKILTNEPVREERIGESRDQNRIDSQKKTENVFVNTYYEICEIFNLQPSTFNLQPSTFKTLRFNRGHLGLILERIIPLIPNYSSEA
jgi:hypothetical protein